MRVGNKQNQLKSAGRVLSGRKSIVMIECVVKMEIFPLCQAVSLSQAGLTASHFEKAGRCSDILCRVSQ